MEIQIYYYTKMPDNLHLRAMDAHEDYFQYGTDEDNSLKRMNLKRKTINIPSATFIDESNSINWDKINRWLEKIFPNFIIYHYDF